MVYTQNYRVDAVHVDCFGRVKPSILLYFAQEIAGEHCLELGADWDTLQKKGLFWAVIRTKVQITRLPTLGETVRIETWPMPETRTAYPRCTVGYDAQGKECFKIIALWVLMDTKNRSMVLPGKSDVRVPGILRGIEPDAPKALPAMGDCETTLQTVGFGHLDRNLHMNNTKYLDWVMDLPDSAFHQTHPLKEMTICYLSEAREGQQITLGHRLEETGILTVDGHRAKTDVPGATERVFAAKLVF